MLARTTFQSDFSFREPFINLQNVVNVLANWIIKKKVCDKNFCNVMKICENCKIVTKAINRLRNYLRFYVRAKITHYSKTFKYFFAIPVFFPVLRLLHFNILYISSANLVHRSVLFGFECGCIWISQGGQYPISLKSTIPYQFLAFSLYLLFVQCWEKIWSCFSFPPLFWTRD